MTKTNPFFNLNKHTYFLLQYREHRKKYTQARRQTVTIHCHTELFFNTHTHNLFYWVTTKSALFCVTFKRHNSFGRKQVSQRIERQGLPYIVCLSILVSFIRRRLRSRISSINSFSWRCSLALLYPLSLQLFYYSDALFWVFSSFFPLYSFLIRQD